jgi:DNA polymerase V
MIMFALVDCNNFYVSCERVFNPYLWKRPVIVLSNNDGCVVARSDEAKQLGIKMAQPAFLMEGFLKANNVAILSSNYVLYGDMSERVMQTIRSIVPNVEPYSVDEMFLEFPDLTIGQNQEMALKIKNTVFQHTGIPVSVGIAPTKTLAKAANYFAKRENGIFIIQTPQQIKDSLEQLPIDEVWGIGEQISRVLKKWKLTNAWQLRCLYDNWVKKTFNITTLRTVTELRGISCIPLEETPPSRKNICYGRSFGSMTTDYEIIREAVATFASRCAEKLRSQELAARVVSVFLETNPFRNDLEQYNRIKAFPLAEPSSYTPMIVSHAINGLENIFKEGYHYKKAGVMVSEIAPAQSSQTNMFVPVPHQRNKKLMETIDTCNKNEGKDTIRLASMGFERKWWLRQEKLSKRYTTQWSEVISINN